MYLIAIDPGKHVGYALAEGGRLVDAGTVLDAALLPRASLAVVEHPRVYPSPDKWRGDPQDIVRLAYLTGQIAATYPASVPVEPRQWRCMAPEHVVRAVTLGRLTEEERHLVESGRLSKHAWDAIGILAWFTRCSRS